jgi:hypothetical protein
MDVFYTKTHHFRTPEGILYQAKCALNADFFKGGAFPHSLGRLKNGLLKANIGEFAVGGCSIRNSGPPNNAQRTAAFGHIGIDKCRTKTR